MKKIVFLIWGVTLFLTGCTNPENLVNKSSETKNESELYENFSDQQITFEDYSIYLKEISVDSIKNEKKVKISLSIKNESLPNNTQLSEDIFSIKAYQKDQELVLVKEVLPNDLKLKKRKKKNLEYEYIMNSTTERIVFSFSANYNKKVTKNYDFYLE